MGAAAQADAGDMERTAQLCRESGEAIAARLQGVMVNLEPMSADLQGKAGMTFQNVKETINTEVTNINRQLDDISEAIMTSGRDMSASDENSDSSLRNATSEVEGTTASNQLTGGKA